MKEHLLDVVKWSLIVVVAGAVFYIVCPKYDFIISGSEGLWSLAAKCNKITGHIDVLVVEDGKWVPFDMNKALKGVN